MSMYDWNGDGKKDSTDNFIEYQIFNDSTKNSGGSNHSFNGNMSTLGAIGCVIGGLVVTSLLFSGADLDNVPGILLAIVWIVASIAIAAVVGDMKN